MDILIDDISFAAYEAIEQAAAEAARAAALAALNREAAAIREAHKWRTEAEKKEMEVKAVKRTGVKNAVIAGAVCLFCGFAVGIAIPMRNEQ